jgi:hypothetical protein
MERDWMPVFALHSAPRGQQAAHPDHRGDIPSRTEGSVDDVELRVGTAFAQDSGGFVIELYALPRDGRLLVRPPRDSEYRLPSERP